ncbi:MAG: UDP-N-acetylmuramate--L-alanine ligase, partial [Oscillospiraceae bacterium]
KTMGFKNIWAVFQPFTFSRTKMLLNDFSKALKIADKVVLAPIMGSREINIYDIYSSDLGDLINNSICLDTFEEIADYIKNNAKSGDMVITLGCGDIYKAGKLMLK